MDAAEGWSGLRVELFARIRRDARVEGLSVRALAVEHKVHRGTVRQALESAAPPERKPRQGVAWRLEPFKSAIDAMLVEDTSAPRKQRHTARRILARLVEEHRAEDLSYSTVRDYVRVRRAQVDVEAGRRVEVFVPQEHSPGAEAEVDFGEVFVVLNGVKTKCHMFVFRLSHAGKAIHRITRPRRRKLSWKATSRPSTISAACRSGTFVMTTSRARSQRWCSGRAGSARRTTAGCCSVRSTASMPSIANLASRGAHEKGGVEVEVGWFRRNRLSPMPVAESLDELNDRIRAWEVQDDHRRINDRIRTIGEDFAAEQPFLAPLPPEEFDPGLVLNPRVDRFFDGHSADGEVLRPGTVHR